MTRPELMPDDTPDVMAPMWAACLSWALSEAGIREAFERETGMRFVPPRHALEKMIDEATGHDRAYVMAFVPWFNVNVWGPIDGPTRDESS